MKNILTLTLLATLYSCAPKEKKLAPDNRLEKTLEAFNTAFAEGNLEFLDKHTTAEYRHTNGNSKSFGKVSWFNYLRNRKADLTAGELVMETYEMSELEIQSSETSALITGKIHTKGTNKGTTFDRQFRVTHYWVLEEGTWKRAGFHDTEIN